VVELSTVLQLEVQLPTLSELRINGKLTVDTFEEMISSTSDWISLSVILFMWPFRTFKTGFINFYLKLGFFRQKPSQNDLFTFLSQI
jgi:hypothetical protein